MLKWSLNYNKVAWKIFMRSGDTFSIQWLRTDVGIARCCGDSVNLLKPPWLAGSESSVRLLGLDRFSPGLEWSAVIPLHPRQSLKSEWRHVCCQTHRLWSGPQPENPWKHSRSLIYKSFCKNHGMAFPLFLNNEAYNLVHFYGDPRGIIESIIERTQDRWKKHWFPVDVSISYQRKYEESWKALENIKCQKFFWLMNLFSHV